ncbi:MAG: Uma2 family endonuclease [Polyangiales bacterium]
MPHLPETAAFDTVPDWICEVLSPSTEVHDRARRRHAYARAGVEHAWLVDPIGRTLEAFRREGFGVSSDGHVEGDARARRALRRHRDRPRASVGAVVARGLTLASMLGPHRRETTETRGSRRTPVQVDADGATHRGLVQPCAETTPARRWVRCS